MYHPGTMKKPVNHAAAASFNRYLFNIVHLRWVILIIWWKPLYLILVCWGIWKDKVPIIFFLHCTFVCTFVHKESYSHGSRYNRPLQKQGWVSSGLKCNASFLECKRIDLFFICSSLCVCVCVSCRKCVTFVYLKTRRLTHSDYSRRIICLIFIVDIPSCMRFSPKSCFWISTSVI